VGGNLFHSFGKFSIYTGESATFSGPTSVKNVISRVTGGERSWLDGTLRSTIPNANLYLLNSAGILFGPNASLDVNGSFHASTANYLRLGEEGRFDATEPRNSLLTSAPPSAFGFLGDNPAPLSIQGSKLRVPEGKTLSLVSGDLTINNSQLAAPGGQLQIASAGSAGEVVVSEVGLGTESLTQRGAISVSTSLLDTSSNAAGKIYVVGGQIALVTSEIRAGTGSEDGRSISLKADALSLTEGANISSSTHGKGTAGSVNVVVAGKLEVLGGGPACNPPLCLPKGIVSLTSDQGHAGSVTVNADRILIDGKGSLNITAIGSATLSTATGNAGDTQVHARELKLLNGGIISSSTFGNGHAATVSIQADHLVVVGLGSALRPDGQPVPSSIDSSTLTPGTTGNAGEVRVTAGELEISESGAISSTTLSRGNAGKVTVDADKLIISGGPGRATGITSSADQRSRGNAGTVIVHAKRLVIDGKGGPTVTGIGSVAFSGSAGNAGDAEVTAVELELRDGGAISSTSWSGNAGKVTVEANRLLITGFHTIRRAGVPIQEPSAIASSAERSSTGAGGTVKIKAKEIRLKNQGLITARSFSPQDAGDVTIQTDSLHLENATISTETEQAGGGNITIQARDLVTLIHSNITTSVTGGDENAGNIKIAEPAALTLVEGSGVQANAKGGDGGNLRVTADTILADAPLEAILTATSERGINGRVEINSPDVDITAGLVPLPASFFDATTILTKPCAERSGADVISLTTRKYEVLPDSPYALQVSQPRVTSALSITGQASASRNSRTLNWLLPSVGECKEWDHDKSAWW
jgi:filamentous hemagglutinin family protein